VPFCKVHLFFKFFSMRALVVSTFPCQTV
jgi:hypothetical protein